MLLTEEQHKEFKVLALPLMQWLSDNYHPYAKVIVDSETAEVVEGIACVVRVPKH
jgi:hypothetical protein